MGSKGKRLTIIYFVDSSKTKSVQISVAFVKYGLIGLGCYLLVSAAIMMMYFFEWGKVNNLQNHIVSLKKGIMAYENQAIGNIFNLEKPSSPELSGLLAKKDENESESATPIATIEPELTATPTQSPTIVSTPVKTPSPTRTPVPTRTPMPTPTKTPIPLKTTTPVAPDQGTPVPAAPKSVAATATPMTPAKPEQIIMKPLKGLTAVAAPQKEVTPNENGEKIAVTADNVNINLGENGSKMNIIFDLLNTGENEETGYIWVLIDIKDVKADSLHTAYFPAKLNYAAEKKHDYGQYFKIKKFKQVNARFSLKGPYQRPEKMIIKVFNIDGNLLRDFEYKINEAD